MTVLGTTLIVMRREYSYASVTIQQPKIVIVLIQMGMGSIMTTTGPLVIIMKKVNKSVRKMVAR